MTLSPTVISSFMHAHAQAINEYREGPNVDGSLWTEVCGQKLWTSGGSESVLTTPRGTLNGFC